MSTSDQLSSLLNSLLSTGKGAIPLSISLKEDEEVQRLKSEIEVLEERCAVLAKDKDRAEYLYRCESVLNNKLVDTIRENGIELSPEFFIRPF